jgi:hypothetical protein
MLADYQLVLSPLVEIEEVYAKTIKGKPTLARLACLHGARASFCFKRTTLLSDSVVQSEAALHTKSSSTVTVQNDGQRASRHFDASAMSEVHYDEIGMDYKQTAAVISL